MIGLGRKLDHAIAILAYLSGQPQGQSARRIAHALKLPPRFAANILKELHRQGLVRSLRGARGGYSLARPAAEITVHEVIQAWAPASAPAQAVCDCPVPCMAGGEVVRQRVTELLCRLTLLDVTREVMGPGSLVETATW